MLRLQTEWSCDTISAAREVDDQVPQLNPIWRLSTYTSHRIKIPSDLKQKGIFEN